MNIKKYIIYGLAAMVGITIHSCNVLDVDPLDQYTDAAVWSDLILVEAYLNTSYSRVTPEVQKGSRFASLTDEMHQRHLYGTDQFLQGRWSPDFAYFGWDQDNGNTAWTYFYRAIKELNNFFDNIDKTPTPYSGDDAWKQRLIGEATFLRAYFYHVLFSYYGRVPIITSVHEVTTPTEDYTETRAPIEEVCAFIVSECDKAIAILPTTYPAAQLGRATKGAAMAVKCRTLLYAASPLFGTPSAAKWQAASDAHKALIDLGVYSLSPVANSNQYAALFTTNTNPETIFQKLFDQRRTVGNNQIYTHQTPAGPGNGFGGWGTHAPTHNIVCKFQMADGTPYVPSNDTTAYPWANRDLRLKGTVLLDGERWGYTGTTRREIEFWVSEDSINGWQNATTGALIQGRDSEGPGAPGWWNAPYTSYLQRKFLGDSTYDNTNSAARWAGPGIIFRMAEFYLNYAECQIELGNNAEALKYINMVRERALMPPATGADIRAEYEYERQIELVFEGQRWFDIRRWMTAESVINNEPIWGLRIRRFKDGSKSYTVKPEVIQERRFVAPENYWVPIPRSELNRTRHIDALPYTR